MVKVDCLEFDPQTRFLTGPAKRVRLVGDVCRVIRALMEAAGETVSFGTLAKACRKPTDASVKNAIHRCRRRLEQVGADAGTIRADRGRGYAIGGNSRVQRTFTVHQLALLGEVLATHPNQAAAAVIRAAL